jgi:hypothetical protein
MYQPKTLEQSSKIVLTKEERSEEALAKTIVKKCLKHRDLGNLSDKALMDLKKQVGKDGEDQEKILVSALYDWDDVLKK